MRCEASNHRHTVRCPEAATVWLVAMCVHEHRFERFACELHSMPDRSTWLCPACSTERHGHPCRVAVVTRMDADRYCPG